MKGKKDYLALWLYRTGLMRLIGPMRSSCLIVINYHRIRSDNKQNFTLFDDEVFGPTRSELWQHFHWLKHNVDVISENDLIYIASGKISPPSRSVVITFDDGYIDNYTLAYPLLRHHGLSAIFFIPTQAMEERTVGWWDYIAYLLKKTERETIFFEGKEISLKFNIRQSINNVLSYIDNNKKDVDDLLLALRLACEVEMPASEIQDKELMTWENVKEVSKHNISIGAHTHSHRILSGLNIQSQKFELMHSKQIIEEKIGIKVRSMSYPVGNYHHFTEDTKRLAFESGYDLAFSFLTGINPWGKLDAMDVKRISISNYLPRFVGTMRLPCLFCDWV